jgi:hypothetical protein
MAGGGVVHGSIIAAYDSLVHALEEASTRSNVGFVEWTEPISSRFRVSQEDSDVAEFDAVLHLYDWKARDVKLSILVHARERIRRSTGGLLQSSIHVGYYRLRNSAAEQLQNIHYDYKGEEAYHPVFHAQLCEDPVPLTAAQEAELSFTLPRVGGPFVCFREAKIPTSDMTLGSLLLCLAADHIKGAFFNEFIASVRSLQTNMPAPVFESTKRSLNGSDHLRSSHWFAHM